MKLFLLGSTAMASGVAGLLFLKMWQESRDRLYILFACSFWLEGLTRVGLALTSDPSEAQPAYYLPRIVGYGLIVAAIIDKNVRKA